MDPLAVNRRLDHIRFMADPNKRMEALIELRLHAEPESHDVLRMHLVQAYAWNQKLLVEKLGDLEDIHQRALIAGQVVRQLGKTVAPCRFSIAAKTYLVACSR